ncbi:MAG: GDSL-type esterase/lipase family protein [Candidatus Omnitrophota bacterium]
MRKSNLWYKQLCNIFLFFLLVILVSGCGKREIVNVGSKGKNIICFGDSITYGYGAEPQESYPSVLAKISGFPVINAGIDGDTSASGLKRIDRDVLSKNPLLVIIEFTGNDFLKKVPLGQTADNIREMIDVIQKKGAMVAIVDISAGLLLKDYRPLLHKISKEKKAIFIPSILSGIVTNPSMKSDFLHPNGNGYKIIAQRIYKKILIPLKENETLTTPEKL